MKKYFVFYMLMGLSLSANAQSDMTIIRSNSPVRFVPGSAVLQNNPATGTTWQSTGSPFAAPIKKDYVGNASHNKDKEDKQTKGTSEHKLKGELHGSVDLSVMAGFGKGAPKGAGFAQNINLDYTTPLGKRGWLTVGGYLNHLNWDGINTTNVGLYGELGYHFNDHWSAYIYGQKSLANSGYGYGYYGGYYGGYWGYPGYYDYYGYPSYNAFGDKLGAALRWTPNRNFSLQISVEKDWYPSHNNHRYFDQYNYPTPRQ